MWIDDEYVFADTPEEFESMLRERLGDDVADKFHEIIVDLQWEDETDDEYDPKEQMQELREALKWTVKLLTEVVKGHPKHAANSRPIEVDATKLNQIIYMLKQFL